MSILAPDSDWANGAWPAMAVASPTSLTLFFTQKGDVWRWTPDGGVESVLSDVTWYRPTISADGHYLAYEADRDGATDIYLVDLAEHGKPVRISQGGTDPVFLDATHLWYQREGMTGGCTGGPEPTGVIRDVASGEEMVSDLQQVITTWPSTSSSH